MKQYDTETRLILCILMIACCFFITVGCLIAYMGQERIQKVEDSETILSPSWEYISDDSIRAQDLYSIEWEEKDVALWVLENKAHYLNTFDEADALELVETTKRITEENSVIDYRYILALMCRESRFDKNAVSPAGAVGYTQLIPKWFLAKAEELGFDDLSNPEANITLCVLYLDEMYQETRDLRLATIGYGIGLDRAVVAYNGEPDMDTAKLENFYADLLERVS